MPDLNRASVSQPEKKAGFTRARCRQAAIGVSLAVLFPLNDYVNFGVVEPWIEYVQFTLSGALLIDYFVRPVAQRVMPDFIVFGYDKRQK